MEYKIDKPFKTIFSNNIMVNYKDGKIYRLVCNITSNQYIGSTTQSLSQRLGGHKAEYKRFLEGKITYQISSFSILSQKNFEMVLIEEFPCENKNQLERRERHFIETMECINKIKPAQTRDEMIESNKQYSKQYYKDNKEERKKYLQENKDVIKEKNKQYREENKEVIKEKEKQYRQDNKEVIKEKKMALTNCECGGKYQRTSKSRHFKTVKHTSYIQ